jgi:hypothetical protein
MPHESLPRLRIEVSELNKKSKITALIDDEDHYTKRGML